MSYRARDKLEEAQFFLEKIREVNPKSQDFRFYLSALANASRSVTWVLKAELKGAHGEAFEEWWSEQWEKLDDAGLPLKTLAWLRNTFAKEGNILPMRLLTQEFDEGPLERVEIQYENLGPGSDSLEIKAEVRLPDGGALHGGGLEEADRIARDGAVAAVRALIELGPSLELQFEGFVIGEDLPPMAPDDLIASFEKYLKELEKLLNEATAMFPSSEKT